MNMFSKKALLAAVMCSAFALAPAALADTVELTGVIRDFKRGDQSGGHPDFETAGSMSRFGHVLNMVTMELGEDGKPVYNPVRPTKDTMYSKTSFDQWFRDVPNVNMSAPFTLTLNNNQNGPGGVYSYSNNAFWPINGQHFGNQGLSKNFHFTFELNTKFLYRPGQQFTFIGDDDVWVYINDSRVIDIGGVHSAVTGSVLLLDGKAFVTKAHFPAGGVVQSVSTAMASSMATKWSELGLPGTCPILSGDRYIDLDIDGGNPDIRSSFTATSATVKSTDSITDVVLMFDDGSSQSFNNLSSGKSGTFTSSDASKTLKGVYVRTANQASETLQWFGADGSGGPASKLDFFFAERHTTQSNFRIDTSINLETVPPTTVSPLYD